MSADVSDKRAPATLTILETGEHIADHLRGRGEAGDLGLALGLLRDASIAGALTATGEVDGNARDEISAAEWRDLTFDFGDDPGFVVGCDFVGADALTTEPTVRTIHPYRGCALMDQSAPAGFRVPGENPEGEPAYFRVVGRVRVGREDVERLWPHAHDRAVKVDEAAAPRSTVVDEKRCQKWLVTLMQASPKAERRKADYKSEAEAKFRVGTRAFDRAWRTAILETGAHGWAAAGPKLKSKRS